MILGRDHFARNGEAIVPAIAGLVVPMTAVFVTIALAWFVSLEVPVRDGFGLMLLALGLFALVNYLAFHNERSWILLALVFHAAVLAGSRERAIGPGEVAYGVFVIGGLAAWFAKAFVRRERIVTSSFDLLLVVFGVASTLVTVIAATLHDANPVLFLKEWGITVDILFYFPLRRVLRSPRDVFVVLALFGVVAMANSALAVLTYRERLAEAVYDWQLNTRSNVNEPTSIALLIISVTVFAYASKVKWALVGLAGSAIGLGVLAISYSRGPILSGLLGTLIMSSMIPMRKSRRVVVALVVSLGVGIGTLTIVYPRFASAISSNLGNRIASIANASRDLSLKARLYESERLLTHYIPASPLIGYGYGVPFTFYSAITRRSTSVVFAHNGYLWAMYKFGIPLTVLLMLVVLYPVLRLPFDRPMREAGLNRALAAAATGYIVCVLLMNMTSTVFTGVSGMMNFALAWALLDYVRWQNRPEVLDETITTHDS